MIMDRREAATDRKRTPSVAHYTGDRLKVNHEVYRGGYRYRIVDIRNCPGRKVFEVALEYCGGDEVEARSLGEYAKMQAELRYGDRWPVSCDSIANVGEGPTSTGVPLDYFY
jgi:hypothetical protein